MTALRKPASKTVRRWPRECWKKRWIRCWIHPTLFWAFSQLTTPMWRLAMTRLYPRHTAVVRMVNEYGQVTTSQVQRVHFPTGTEAGAYERARRTLARLVDLGRVRCLKRASEDGEHVFLPATSKARVPDPHTLDITEPSVRLRVADPAVHFEPERLALERIGGVELKPDAKIVVGKRHYFAEVDLASEYRTQLSEKMRRYVRAYNRSDDDVFPLVVFLAHSPERVRFIQSVAKRQEIPQLFNCILFDEAVERLI